jgi:hypothetical protein
MSRRYLRQRMSRGYGTELPIQNVRSSVVAESSADRELKNPTTGIAGCCARAASGHAMIAPPSSVMNLRRFTIRSPTERIAHLDTAGDGCAEGFQSAL